MKSKDNSFFIDGFFIFIPGLIGLIIFGISVAKDMNNYQRTKRIKSFITTIIGLILIAILSILFIQDDYKKNAPTLIYGFNDGGFNGFSIDFKKNGNYVMANGSGLGQSYFYGIYEMNDSIITIDKNEIDNVIKTNKFVIRKEPYFPKESQKTEANYITQIDQNGNEIDQNLRFRVTVDNR